MAGIDDLLEFMDAEQRRQDEEDSLLNSVGNSLRSLNDKILATDKPIENFLFGEGFIDDAINKVSKVKGRGSLQGLGAALAKAGEGAGRATIKTLGFLPWKLGETLGEVASGASSVYDDSTIDDSLEAPNTTAAVQTSADYTKAIKDNMAKEAARNIQDNQKILKQLGIGEYISQEASKASPFFVIKGNEPSTSDSKTKGFSRSSRSIGEKAREDNYASVLKAIESGDFSSASGALSGLPKEDKTNFLALINTAQQRPQSRGGETPLGLVAAIKTIEAFNASPPDIKQDKQARAKYFEALDVLSKYQQ